MKYDKALIIATEWMRKLSPFCDRIAIAGSIRRERPEVKDIELVCIPKMVDIPGLFGAHAGRHPEFISILSNEEEGNFLKMLGDPREGKYVKLSLMEHGINIDLFIATPENWGHILAIRTGPADYSHKVLGSAWVKAGFHSVDGMLMRGTTPIAVREEDRLFDLIGIPYTEPKNRVAP